MTPQDTIIAGISIDVITAATGLQSFRIGRVRINNAFVLYDGDSLFYIYVNPKYSNYRKLFQRLVYDVPEKYHVDHLLARNLAVHFNYNYVLIGMVTDVVNIRHGRFEKIKNNFDYSNIPPIIYLDDRIYDKMLSRNPTARRSMEKLLVGYDPFSRPKFGLTLSQKGIWNSAFGFHLANRDNLKKCLRLISQ